MITGEHSVYRGYGRHLQPGGKWCRSNPGNAAIAEERRRAFAELLRAARPPRPGLSVLEVGSGRGESLAEVVALLGAGCRGVAVDLLAWRLPPAGRQAVAPVCGAGEALPFPPAVFDLVVLSTVISSIGDRRVARRLGGEVARVLRPDGAVLWYDLARPSPGNRHVRAVRPAELGRILPGFRMEGRRVTVLPPLARRLGPFTERAYPVLARLPGLRSHRTALLTRRGV